MKDRIDIKEDIRMAHPYRLFWCGCLWMILMGVWACSSEEHKLPDVQPETSVEVTLRITTKAVTQNREDDIHTVRVYAFRQGKVEGYYKHTFPDTDKADTRDIIMKLPSDNISFYVIANEEEAGPLQVKNGASYVLPEPDTSTGVPNVHAMTVTEAELESLTFRKLPVATLMADGGNKLEETTNVYQEARLPMAGQQTVRLSNSQQIIQLPLQRSVAKMTLSFTKTGVGKLFMGRGLYLYNDPQYGYLFPKTASQLMQEPVGTFISRKEDAAKPHALPLDEFHQDSPLYQLNGRVLLHCGWPEETEQDVHPSHLLDINEVTGNINDNLNPSYTQIPKKAFYLFANPYQSTPSVDHLMRPVETEQGYYLKILAHEHLTNNQEEHRKEVFYVCLPQIEANDFLEVRSVFTLDGYVYFDANWMVKDWNSGGGDITFE